VNFFFIFIFRNPRHRLQRRLRLGLRGGGDLRHQGSLVQSGWQARRLDRVQRHRGRPNAT
jgi:hypothetical protein